MLTLDHLVVVAPSLGEGIAHVRDCLDVQMPPGGEHPQMGTHNCLMRIGQGISLEIIAIQPDSPQPPQARWFGLDDLARRRRDWDAGFRLRAWVARTNDLSRYADRDEVLFGRPMRVSRGERAWDFLVRSDGELPGDGALPYLIDWGPQGTPADSMADLDVRLTEFTIAHPDPDAIAEAYRRYAISGAPRVEQGPSFKLRALFDTPSGPRELT